MGKIDKYTKKLELNSVLQLLSQEASMEDAKQEALLIEPASELVRVKELLKNTDDAYRLIASYSAPAFGSAVNVASALARAAVGCLAFYKRTA